MLVTPMERRTNAATVDPWARAMREVAAEDRVPLIDQWAMSKELWTALGPNVGTAFSDQTHLSGYGGYLLSKLIVREIKAGVPELARFVAEDFKDMDPAHPEPPPEYLRQSGGPGGPRHQRRNNHPAASKNLCYRSRFQNPRGCGAIFAAKGNEGAGGGRKRDDFAPAARRATPAPAFPAAGGRTRPLRALDGQFNALLALADVGRIARPYAWCGNGAPPHARVWLMQAFLAKSVHQFPATAALRESLASRPTLRRLCGWESVGDIPSEPTFGRVVDHLSDAQALPQQIHEVMVRTHAGPKPVGHLSRDATAIAVPERRAPSARR